MMEGRDTSLPGTYALEGYFSGSDRKGKPDYLGTVKIRETGGELSVEWTWADGGAQGWECSTYPVPTSDRSSGSSFPWAPWVGTRTWG